MSFPYAQQNANSRRRLESLVSGLSDADLARSTDYGWTVAALLAHLAFWDHRMSVILQRWQEQRLDESPINSMAVNDALKPSAMPLSRVPPPGWPYRPPKKWMPNSKHYPTNLLSRSSSMSKPRPHSSA